MEEGKAIVESSSPPTHETQSQISVLLCETWQQMQDTMQNMVKMTCEIEQSSAEIIEEIEKCKESLEIKNRLLEEEKENIQKAALAVLQIFSAPETI